jgi:hypothetical protein
VRVWIVILSWYCALPVLAEESTWRTSWDGTLYGYANSTELRDDSMLNTGNQFAQLPQRRDVAEARFNFKTESDDVRIALRPILITQNTYNAFGNEHRNEGYLSQGQARVRVAESWQASVGREVLNWGAAQFRSPSSPFYFDNGRSDPMRELSGVEAVKVMWTPDVHDTAYLARVTGSGHVVTDLYRDTWLFKSDHRGADGAVGMVLARKDGQGAFFGVHGQQSVGDAWLLYGEASSYTRQTALISSADTTIPFDVVLESSRRSDVLVGANYTFDDGRSLAAEYLYYGHGYTSDEASAYFTRIADANSVGSWQTTGLALATMPPLLNRDYLHVVWQNNLMDSTSNYWRLMWTRNLIDHSDELAGYGEASLSARISGYALAVLPLGNARQEFSGLLKRSLTFGVKIALP